MATMQQLADQIMALHGTVQSMEQLLGDARTRIAQLEQGHGDGGGGDRQRHEDKLLDVKKLFPDKLLKPEDWKEWSEEFMDYIEEKDEATYESLQEAASARSEIALPDDEEDVKKVRAVFKLLKRLLKENESKTIQRNIQSYNALELWRLLHQNFEPQNESTNLNLHKRILNPKPVVNLRDMLNRIARWEKIQIDYHSKTGSEAINDATRSNIFISMMPKVVAEKLQLDMMARPDDNWNYAALKRMVTL